MVGSYSAGLLNLSSLLRTPKVLTRHFLRRLLSICQVFCSFQLLFMLKFPAVFVFLTRRRSRSLLQYTPFGLENEGLFGHNIEIVKHSAVSPTSLFGQSGALRLPHIHLCCVGRTCSRFVWPRRICGFVCALAVHAGLRIPCTANN